MTIKPYYNEQAVKLGDETYRLVINFKTIDATEQALNGRGYDEILGEILSPNPSVGLQARVVWGLLQEHHPEVSLEEASALARGEAGSQIGAAIGSLIAAAFPLTGDKKEKAKNPPKPRGTSAGSSRRGASKTV